MTNTTSSAHFLTWCFTPPPDYAPIPVQQLDGIRTFVENQLNWTSSCFSLEHSKDSDTLSQRVIDSLIQSKAQLNLLLLIGHGKKRTLQGREHPINHLFCNDTDLNDLSLTTFSLDDFVRTLTQSKGIGPTLLMIDACEVNVRSYLDAGSPLVALLAHPDGKAEIEGDKSLLTSAFSETLRSFAQNKQARSVQELINRMQEYVQQESNHQQVPNQRTISSADFLRNTLPIKQRSLLSNISLHDHMVNMCLKDEFSDDALTELELHLQATSAERNSELAFIVSVKRYEKRNQRRRQCNEAELAQLIHDKEVIESRIGQTDLSPLVEATACLLVVSTDHNKQLDPFKKESYLKQALTTLQKLPYSETKTILTSRIYDCYGSFKRDQGTKSKALHFYHQSIELKEQLKDQIGLEISRQNLGWFHLACGDFKKAASAFQEGRNQVTQQLKELEKSKTRFQLYGGLLTSWTIHTYGLLVTQLIDIHSCALELGNDPIGGIATEVNAKRKLLRRFNGWVIPNFFGELEHLCLYSTDDFRKDPYHKKTGPLGKVIEIIKECNTHGMPHGLKLIDELKDWELEALEKQEIYQHMTWLAVLSVLCRKPNYKQEPHRIRRQLISLLRDTDRYQSLPRPENSPWAFDHALQNIELKIDDWSEWGPNESQKRCSDPKHYAPSFLVTSNFIQVLTWSHILLGLNEAHKSITDAFNYLLESGSSHQKDKVTQLSLGTYLTFARRIFTDLSFESEWGCTLQNCWVGDALLSKSGYTSFEDLVQIRNDWSHSDNPSTRALQTEIDRHQIIIKFLSEAIAYPGADLPELQEDSHSDRLSNEQLRSVILVNSREQRFDCGPFLLTPRSAVGQVYYLPYRIDNSVLNGESGKIEYRRYGNAESHLDSKVSLTYYPESK